MTVPEKVPSISSETLSLRDRFGHGAARITPPPPNADSGRVRQHCRDDRRTTKRPDLEWGVSVSRSTIAGKVEWLHALGGFVVHSPRATRRLPARRKSDGREPRCRTRNMRSNEIEIWPHIRQCATEKYAAGGTPQERRRTGLLKQVLTSYFASRKIARARVRRSDAVIRMNIRVRITAPHQSDQTASYLLLVIV